MQKTDGTFHVSNMFNDINGATPGTVVEQKWLNTVQEELINAVSLGMDPIAPGTLESWPAYRDTQIRTLLKLIMSGHWFVNTASVTIQQALTEIQTGIVSDGSYNMAICRSSGGALSLCDSANYGMIFYNGVSDASPRYWKAIEYGDGIFMAVASSGGAAVADQVAYRTAAGGSWVNIGPTLTSVSWQSLATDGAGNWVICASSSSGNKVYYSSNNGSSWSPATTAAVHLSTNNWYAAAYGNGTFMIGGEETSGPSPIVYMSTDGGDTWTAASTPPTGDREISGLAYHQTGSSGEWIAVMGAGATWDQYIYRSFGSGDVWSPVQLRLGTNEAFFGTRVRVFDDIVFIPGIIGNDVSGDSFPALLKYTGVNGYHDFVHLPTCDLVSLHDIAKAKEGYIMVGESNTGSNYEYMLRSANIA